MTINMAANQPNERYFINKKIYFHLLRTNAAKSAKAAELIKTFGGQVEEFLDNEISYVLTDIPKSEWPPKGFDSTLEKACSYKVKLMSLIELLDFCSRYLQTASGSDDDDDKGASVKVLKAPFIKHEQANGRYAPSVKELAKWPEINIDSSLPVGRSFFSDPSFLVTPNHSVNNIIHLNNSAQLTQQASLRTINLNNTASTATNQPSPSVTSNNIIATAAKIQNIGPNFSSARNSMQPNNHNYSMAQKLGVKRRHSIYCEICNQKIEDKIEDHIQTSAHKANTDKMSWDEVSKVIDSLPSLSTLNKRRLTTLTPINGEFSEFLCLHKVDSVSSLFQCV